MIPERLELEAFGPFRTKQALDFHLAGASGLFLIHGATGSGKSTLLDALTFALFGETSGNDRDGHDLVCNLADGAQTRVTLTFRHGGSRYRVTRTPKQLRRMVRRDGLREAQPTATLTRLVGDHEDVLEDKPTSVSRRICELLHCDARQFRQTVVLPQGQFRRVVEDDETRERALAELFGTARFDEVQERLKAYAKRLRDDVRALLDEQRALGEAHGVTTSDELAGKVEGARERAGQAERTATDAAAAFTAAVEGLERARGIVDRLDELATARVARDRLEAERGVIDAERQRLAADRRAQEVNPAVAEAARATTEHGQRSEALASAQTALHQATSRQETAEAAVASLEARADEVAAHRDARTRLELLAPLVERFEGLATAARAARATADGAQAEVARLEAQRIELIEQLEGERAELARLGAVLADEATANADDALARERLAAHGAATNALGALAAAASDSDAIRLDELWDPLFRAAATRLAPGAPCPVCGSPDHPAVLGVHDHPAALDGLQEALRSAQQTALTVEAERVRQDERLRQALRQGGWEAEALPARETLEADAMAAAERARAVAQARREHGERSQRVAGLEPHAHAVEEALRPARQAQAEAAAEATRAGTRLEEAQEQLGSDFGGAEAFHAALASARAAVEAFETEHGRRREELQQARTALEVATSSLGAARGEFERAARRLEEASNEAHAALREHGFVASDGSASVAAHEAAMLSSEARAASERRVREHETRVATTTTRIAALEAALAAVERPDLDALEAARSAREGDRDAAFEAREVARRERDGLTDALARWRELERELGDREARARTAGHLSDLVNGTAAGQRRLDLRTYVLKRIMRSVLVHANVHLARMTGGRYQLRLREAEGELRAHGLGLDVEDRHAGGARRRVATLSGGEGFQASLALALGLSETAQRTSGAVELGALFIDEGFGSLDALALDEVVKILRELPTLEGRMVGVITHVEDLKRRIETQVLVQRSDLGSSLEVRQALA